MGTAKRLSDKQGDRTDVYGNPEGQERGRKIGTAVAAKDTSTSLSHLRTKYNYKVNKDDARLMLLQGATLAKVAEKYNCSTQAISQLFNGELQRIQAYLAFKKDPATIYEYKESLLVNHVDTEQIKRMSGYQAAGSANLFREVVRRERGQATEITQVQGIMVEAITKVDDLKEMLSRMGGSK